MHENFIALDKEKRDRIINAAMREFSSKGYKSASTNEIIKKASISKGALFHYFSSKRELFEFLYRYSVDFFMETSEPRIKELPSDVFERWIAFTALKMEIAARYPDMADFMQMAFREDAPEAQGLISDAFEHVSKDLSDKIYDGIDYSKFKPDVDVQKALQIIWWVLEGFALSKQKEPFNISKDASDKVLKSLLEEIESYLAMLKVSFYKTEYLEQA